MEMKLWVSLIVVSAITTSALGEFGGALVKGFYKESCPLAEEIVKHNVEVAVLKDPRMAASLLRLQFHDCFVLVRHQSLILAYFNNNQRCIRRLRLVIMSYD